MSFKDTLNLLRTSPVELMVRENPEYVPTRLFEWAAFAMAATTGLIAIGAPFVEKISAASLTIMAASTWFAVTSFLNGRELRRYRQERANLVASLRGMQAADEGTSDFQP